MGKPAKITYPVVVILNLFQDLSPVIYLEILFSLGESAEAENKFRMRRRRRSNTPKQPGFRDITSHIFLSSKEHFREI
jgi:hypothetical protein